MIINVRLDAGTLSRFRQVAANLGNGTAQRAAIEGLNEAGNLVFTSVKRALQKQTNVRLYGTIVDKTDAHRAFQGSPTYSIRTSGKGLPIKEFFTYNVPGHVVSTPWGVAHEFKRSFQQLYKGGLRARLTSKRKPIRSLYGPSLPKEIVKDKSASAFEAGSFLVKAMIDKRLARLMS